MADIVIKTKLLDDTEVVWDKRWIKSIETNVQSTSNPSEIQYGAIDSSGSATIIDIDGSIYQNIVNGSLKKDNLDIQIYLNGKQVRNHIVTNSNYDKNTNILSLTLQGLFYKLAQEDYAGVSLNVNKTAYELTSKVLSDFGYTIQQIHNALSGNIVVGDYTTKTIENYLKSIIIPYSFIKRNGKKIDAINEICKLAQLQAFEDDDGNIKFVSARPAFNKFSETVNVVNANCQYSPFDSAIILKNKISSVGYESNNSYISMKKNEDISINTYNQTNNIGNVTIDDETKQYYSGLYSDYEKKLSYESTEENNFYVFGDFQISGEDYTDKDRALVCKYTFDSNNFILDDSNYIYENPAYQGKKAIFIPLMTNTSSNKIAFDVNINFSKENKYALQYVSDRLTMESWEYELVSLIFNPKFVLSELDALSGLCNMSNSTIQSVKLWSGLSDSGIYIVKKENLYTCYFCVYNITEHLTSSELTYKNYTGDIKSILLNFNISMYIRCLIESYSEVDKNADFILPRGYLFHSNATIDGVSLYDIVKQDIINDYSNGISNGSITISFADYYDSNGIKTKNKDNGDIFKIGELVRIDKDNSGNSDREYLDETPMIWKIVGRKIRKNNGVVFIDLNLSECKVRSAQQYALSKGISTVTRTYSPSGASTGILTDSDPIYEGDVLTITYSGGIRSYTIINGEYQIAGQDLDGLEQSITVSGNVSISIIAKQLEYVRRKLFENNTENPLADPSTIYKEVIIDGVEYPELSGKEIIGISIDAQYYNKSISEYEMFISRQSATNPRLDVYAEPVESSKLQEVFGGGNNYKGVSLAVSGGYGETTECFYPDDMLFTGNDSIYIAYDENNKWYITRMPFGNFGNNNSLGLSYFSMLSEVRVITKEYV